MLKSDSIRTKLSSLVEANRRGINHAYGNSAINSSERFWRVVVFRESENGNEKLVYKDMIPTNR